MINIQNKSCFYSSFIPNDVIILRDEEFNHCIKTLRHKVNDIVLVTNGRGTLAECKIITITKNEAILNIINKEDQTKNNIKINVYVGIPKRNEAISFIVEKLTELQVDEINFIITKNCERLKINLERLTKIAISSLKQSKNTFLPNINGPIRFHETIKKISDENTYILCNYEGDKLNNIVSKLTHNVLNVFIGPEGGFSAEEISIMKNYNFLELKLSATILRTETACIVATALLKAFL
ncbi:MAG: 16S rRNA (uracil(1498)-N(3))-methyltransferase [Bacteroidales bacterium]|nr:16S rRNA (uracil(1498)-N(3))-methyltransferase [Bacteroidales bacterium]